MRPMAGETRQAQMTIVTGRGRSGTSAVARVLHESGISMGRDLLGPAPFDNPLGFYQERTVVALNESIASGCGLYPAQSLALRVISKWKRITNSKPRPPRRARTASRADVLAAAARHQQAMQDLASEVPTPGGWKDPWFCWTLEAWLPCLARKPRLVICLRGPQAVAHSAMDVFGVTGSDWEQWHVQSWKSMYERLLEVIEEFELEATCVEYDELIASTAETVARLAGFLGHPLDPGNVDSSLRHHASDGAGNLGELYERVKALSR